VGCVVLLRGDFLQSEIDDAIERIVVLEHDGQRVHFADSMVPAAPVRIHREVGGENVLFADGLIWHAPESDGIESY